MKKQVFFLILVMLSLSSCAGLFVPEAPPFPTKGVKTDAQGLILHKNYKTVIKDSSSREWTINYEFDNGRISDSGLPQKFWFVAQNADLIKIFGSKNNVVLAIQQLKKGLSSAKIEKHVNCSNINFCSKKLVIQFIKRGIDK